MNRTLDGLLMSVFCHAYGSPEGGGMAVDGKGSFYGQGRWAAPPTPHTRIRGGRGGEGVFPEIPHFSVEHSRPVEQQFTGITGYTAHARKLPYGPSYRVRESRYGLDSAREGPAVPRTRLWRLSRSCPLPRDSGRLPAVPREVAAQPPSCAVREAMP